MPQQTKHLHSIGVIFRQNSGQKHTSCQESVPPKLDLIHYRRPKLELQLSWLPPPTENILARQSSAEPLLSTLLSTQPQFALLEGFYKLGMSDLKYTSSPPHTAGMFGTKGCLSPSTLSNYTHIILKPLIATEIIRLTSSIFTYLKEQQK